MPSILLFYDFFKISKLESFTTKAISNQLPTILQFRTILEKTENRLCSMRS